MSNHKLNQIFGIESDIIEYEPRATASAAKNDDVPQTQDDIDIDKVKKIHYDLIEKSEHVLNELMTFATDSESLKAYEAISELLKTTGTIAKSLADISLNNKKTQQQKSSMIDASTNNTQNLFMGSTAELQKFLKRAKEELQLNESPSNL